MKIVMLIFVLLFAVAFYFINALINRWHSDHKKLKNLEMRMNYVESECHNNIWELNDLYDRLYDLRDFTDEMNYNINLCAASMLNLSNDIGKLGNRIQKIERKED